MPFVAPEIVILSIYLAVGALVSLVGLPLYFGKVPPNRFYGFRTGRTLRDSEVWYPVNRITGGWLVVTGAATAGVATAAQRFNLSIPATAALNCAVFVVGMALMLVHSVHTLWRIK